MGILDMFGKRATPGPAKPTGAEIDYRALPLTGREYNPNLVENGVAVPYEEQMRRFEQGAEFAATTGGFIRCAKHKMGKIVFACDHCHEQDSQRPQGMIFTPYKYFICMHCYGRYKLGAIDFYKELKTRCYQCCLDEFLRVKAINPRLAVDVLAGEKVRHK